MTRTDIVYVWIDNPPFAADDLKYSLRSVEENWLGQFRVTIVGDKPKGLGEFWHVPHVRAADQRYPKALDSVRKMEAIIAAKHIQDGFVYMYDDTYLLRPMDAMYIRQRVAKCEMALDFHINGSGRKHNVALSDTVKALRDAGFKRIWNYETHTPRFFEKRKMQEVIDTYKPGENRLLLATLYFNHHFKHQEPNILHPMDSVKAVFAGSDAFGIAPLNTEDPLLAMDHYHKCIQGKHFLNHNNAGIQDVGLQYLRHKLWSEPSSCEVQERKPLITAP